MKEAKFKDYAWMGVWAGVLGGVLGFFITPLSWLWWAIDIPLLLVLNWWLLWREPAKIDTTIRCATSFCKKEPQDDDDYCEVHSI